MGMGKVGGEGGGGVGVNLNQEYKNIYLVVYLPMPAAPAIMSWALILK